MDEPADVVAYREGVNLFRQGRVLEALRLFRFAAEHGEERPMEHFALAAAAMQVGDPAGAERSYRRFLEMAPGLPQQEQAARLALARVTAELERKRADEAGRAEQARREEEAARERLAQLRALFDEAVAFYRCGGYQSALDRLEELAGQWGRTGELLNLMGLCRLRMGEPVAALELLTEAHAAQPDSVDITLNLAQLHFEAGLERAQALIEEALAQEPERAAGWHNLAICALARGDHGRACEHWERAARLAPDDPQIRANLEMLTRRQR